MPVSPWVQKPAWSGAEGTADMGQLFSVAGPERDLEAAQNGSQTPRPTELLVVLTTP